MPRNLQAAFGDALAQDDLDAVHSLLRPTRRRHAASALASAPDPSLVALAESKDGLLALELAVEGGRLDVVRRYIELGVSLNTRMPCSRWTPLQLAADRNIIDNLDMLKLIMGPGKADPNLASPDGYTALQVSSFEGMREVVQELLRRGANLHAKTREGDYAHHFAAQDGRCDVLRTLVDASADIDKVNGRGADCLRLAVEGGHVRTVKSILSLRPRLLRVQASLDRLLFIAACTASNGAIPRMLLDMGAKLARMRFKHIPSITAVHAVVSRKHGKGILDELLRKFGERGASARGGDGTTPLFWVRGAGGDQMMQSLLRAGADPEAISCHGLTPLSVAAARGSRSLCRILMDSGASLDYKDGAARCAPLFTAALRGRCEMVKWLLRVGALVNAPNAIAPPLIGAAMGGHLQAIKLLVSAGANVDAVDSDGFSALMWAVLSADKWNKTKFRDIAYVLIRNGRCNTGALSSDGYTALHIAVLKNNVDAIRLLVEEGSDVDACTLYSRGVDIGAEIGRKREWVLLRYTAPALLKHEITGRGFCGARTGGLTPLMLSVVDGNIEACTELLNLGASVNIADTSVPDWQTAFFIAVELGRTNFIDVLAKKGADLSVANQEGKDCTWYACRSPDAPRTLRHVLGLGAAVRTTNACTGLELMHLAAQEGLSAAIDALAAHGQDIEVTDANGETPLFAAVRCGHLNTVAHMVYQLRADPKKQNSLGQSLLHVAAHLQHPKIAACILDAGVDVDARDKFRRTPLITACGVESEYHAGLLGNKANERMSLVSLLLDSGARINACCRRGLRPLHFAAVSGRSDVVRLLLLRGASPDRQTKRGRTALHLAALAGHCEVLNTLASGGCQLAQRDDRGCTALYAACARGHVRAVSVLLRLGSSPEGEPTHLGRTPLVAAARAGHLPVVRLLIDLGNELGLSRDLALRAASRHSRRDIFEELLTSMVHHTGSPYSLRPQEVSELVSTGREKSGYMHETRSDPLVQSTLCILGAGSTRWNTEITCRAYRREVGHEGFKVAGETIPEINFLETNENELVFDVVGWTIGKDDGTDKLSTAKITELCVNLDSTELKVAREVRIFGNRSSLPFYRESYKIFVRAPAVFRP